MTIIISILIGLTSCVFSITKIVFLGDSITAGYTISKESAFPNLIQANVPTTHIQITNAGISGDTSFMLLNRLDWILNKTTPNIAVVCIGANDGLRGVAPSIIEENLNAIVQKLQSTNVQVVLAGMTLPQNYSKEYIQSFELVYKQVAEKNKLIFIPFLLEGVAGVDAFNLSDRIHPNEAGHEQIAKTVFNALLDHNIIPTSAIIKENK